MFDFYRNSCTIHDMVTHFPAMDEVHGALASDRFLRAAEAASHSSALDAAIAIMHTGTHRGAVLVPGCPVGEVPPTPQTTQGVHKPDRISERTLLGAAMRLGEPVGFAQEHGGDIVQDLYPLASSVGRQLSTSSGVELAFHTETAFHPHRPRFLLLLCLRGDPDAATTLCSVDDIVALLPPATVDILRQPRFRCGVDESFGAGSAWVTNPAPVIGEEADGILALTFDGELTFGTDARAEAAIAEVNQAIGHARTTVTLRTGDLLIVDNHRAVHGRSPFTARFDGSDRWLQRTFVVTSLAPSADERVDRIITSRFD